jgi:ABC-type branched-subunit amino acid transport system substrate-binding protein
VTSASPRARTVRRAGIGILVGSVFTLSACGGSALNPKDVLAANAAVSGTLAGTLGTSGNPATGTTGAGTLSGATNGGSTGAGSTGTGSTGIGSIGSISTGSGRTGSTGGTAGSGAHVTTSVGGTVAPATGAKVGSCVGFKNTTGITNSTITVANLADISGPVPGVFAGAMQATKAYAAYFNSTSNICGRKLAVESLDTQTNSSADAVATQKACDETFASVGSMEAFDTGGAAIATSCKLPEMHAIVTNTARAACSTCFSTEAFGSGTFEAAVPDFFTTRDKPATQKAAMLYVNVAASADGAQAQINGEKRKGWKFVYTSPFDIAEFNYGPYVQQLKDNGAQIVQLFGSADMAVRMARAFAAANYHPKYYVMNATSYDRVFSGAGSAVDGSIIYVDFTPVEDASQNAELRLYMRWLQQIAPGALPSYFGLYAWSAARLFAQKAAELGGKLTRASLVDAFRSTNNWTSNGLHAPQDVGGKLAPECWRFLQLHNGAWSPYGSSKYLCEGRVSDK